MKETKGITSNNICWDTRFYVGMSHFMGGHQVARNNYHRTTTFFEHYSFNNNSQIIADKAVITLN